MYPLHRTLIQTPIKCLYFPVQEITNAFSVFIDNYSVILDRRNTGMEKKTLSHRGLLYITSYLDILKISNRRQYRDRINAKSYQVYFTSKLHQIFYLLIKHLSKCPHKAIFIEIQT